MVGCPKQNGWAGVVYHYSQEAYGSSYTLQQEIHASGGAAGNRLGQTQHNIDNNNNRLCYCYNNCLGQHEHLEPTNQRRMFLRLD